MSYQEKIDKGQYLMNKNMINRIIAKVRRAINIIHPRITKAQVVYLNPSEKLKDKRIVITGGGRGLGLAMARRCVAEGADVLIAGRNVQTLKKSAEEIGCKYLQQDVQDIASFEKFFIGAEKILGGSVDCLVNNAGISLHENTFLDVTIDTFDIQINTNFKGAFFLAQKFIERYKANSLTNGNILFISSETSVTADERPYGLIKASINSLVQGLASRYIKDGIRVNAIAPGVTASEMTGVKTDGNLYRKNKSTSRVYLPEEMAEIVCFLLSDASNVLNGQILVCNEGNTINARWN